MAIKKGDIVRVTKPSCKYLYSNREIGYGDAWVNHMDEYQGIDLLVDSVDYKCGVFHVEGVVWRFPLMCITEKVKADFIISKEGTCGSIKRGVTIKKGDIVQVTKPVDREQYWDEDAGYGEIWVSNMDEFDGQDLIVDEVDVKQGIFHAKGQACGWGFPLQCISQVVSKG